MALGLIALAGACVTVNVNFPEGAVQKATDDYVRDLYRARKTESSTDDGAFFFQNWIGIAEAQAEEEIKPFNLNSPDIKSIQSSQASRIDSLIQYKKKGYIGENNEGYLILRKESDVSSKKLLAKKVSQVISDENSDRKKLYEIALDTNKMDSSNLPKIQRSFSRSFQAESPSDTWVQSPGGSWAKKR